MTSKKNIILLALAIIYCASYLGLRATHVIVHRTAYSTDSEGVARTFYHFVQSGDPTTDEQDSEAFIGDIALAFAFLPALTAERMYWYITIPLDSEWPYEITEEPPAKAEAGD